MRGGGGLSFETRVLGPLVKRSLDMIFENNDNKCGSGSLGCGRMTVNQFNFNCRSSMNRKIENLQSKFITL